MRKKVHWIGMWSRGVEAGKGGDGQDGSNLWGTHFQGFAHDMHEGNYSHHAKDGNNTRQG